MDNKILKRVALGGSVALVAVALLVAYDKKLSGEFEKVRQNGYLSIEGKDVPVIFHTTEWMMDNWKVALTEMGGVVVRDDVSARAQRFVVTYLASTIARTGSDSVFVDQALAGLRDPLGAASYAYVKAFELNRLRLEAIEFAKTLPQRMQDAQNAQ